MSLAKFLCGIYFLFYFILQDSRNITDINKTNTLQNLHTIRAGTITTEIISNYGVPVISSFSCKLLARRHVVTTMYINNNSKLLIIDY